MLGRVLMLLREPSNRYELVHALALRTLRGGPWKDGEPLALGLVPTGTNKLFKSG